MTFSSKKIEGFGLGLRFPHFDDILKNDHTVPWFEVITDDFLENGPHHEKLLKLRRDFPIVLHSIGLNVGGVDDLNQKYLEKFKNLFDIFKPAFISDHLCWSAHNGKYHHDLLPIPRTKEGLQNVCSRINLLQDFFNRELALENITAYVGYKESEYSEVDFIREIVKATGCKLLLDITNILINHVNREESPKSYFDNFPMEAVVQIHIAGGELSNGTVIDTHGSTVHKNDIEVLKKIISNGYDIPILLERDRNIPSFLALEKELAEIRDAIK